MQSMIIEKEKEALDALKKFSKEAPDDIKEVIRLLNTNNCVSDNDLLDFNSEAVQYWSAECTEHMRELGYKGSEIYFHSKYYNEDTPGPRDYSNCSDLLCILYNVDMWGRDIDINNRQAEKVLDFEMEKIMLSRENNHE